MSNPRNDSEGTAHLFSGRITQLIQTIPDGIIFTVLVLNATGLFRFLAPLFGAKISHVSLVLMVLSSVYLGLRFRIVLELFRERAMILWAILLVLWPLGTLTYAPSLDVREIALLFNGFSLLLIAVVYTTSNGLSAIHRAISTSIVITLVGLFLSLKVPTWFEPVALLADARTYFMGRPFGFFMQPNSLAIGMGFLFVAWFFIWKRKNTYLEVLAILIFMFVMLITGSRTGMVLWVVIVTLHLFHGFRISFGNKKEFGKFMMRFLILVVGVIIVNTGTTAYLNSMEGKRQVSEEERQVSEEEKQVSEEEKQVSEEEKQVSEEEKQVSEEEKQVSEEEKQVSDWEVSDRMKSLSKFQLTKSESIWEDPSVKLRLSAQSIYWKLIAEKPILGHGIGSDTHYQDNKVIALSAHSTAIASAMQYGIFYPFVFLILMTGSLIGRSRRDLESMFQSNSTTQFVTLVLIVFLIGGELLVNRTFIVTWGVFFSVIYFPQHVLRNHPSGCNSITKKKQDAHLEGISTGPKGSVNV